VGNVGALSFYANHVNSIVNSLIQRMNDFQDWDNPLYCDSKAPKLPQAKGLRTRAEATR
jgi:hypothetical protein